MYKKMMMLRRFFLWIVTNVAVIALISIVVPIILRLLGLEYVLYDTGLNLMSIMIYSAVVGFAGSLISLFMSKTLVKWNMKVRVIKTPQGPHEQLLMHTIEAISSRLNITMPEVGIYPSKEVNAFATGARKNAALVAVSVGLLETMSREEIEGILAHEMAHIANGDMVTLTLIQGVVNTFVVALARVAMYVIGSRNEEMGMLAYHGLYIGLQVLFGALASPIVYGFSRWREYRADAGGAQYVGSGKMISALQALRKMKTRNKAAGSSRGAYAAMKMSNTRSWFGSLYSTRPPLEKRIEALQKGSYN